jgi:hypothetical protein
MNKEWVIKSQQNKSTEINNVEVITLPILGSGWYRGRIKNSSFFGWIMDVIIYLAFNVVADFPNDGVFFKFQGLHASCSNNSINKIVFFLGLCMMY